MMKAILSAYFFFHWVTCLFSFLYDTIERDVAQTYGTINGMKTRPLYEKYNITFYGVCNIVTSLGSGDVYPATD